MRPFRDRPDVKVLGRWYWCAEGALPLPFWHAFGTQYQDTFREEFLEYVIGEQVGWHGPNYHQPNPRYTGKHFCGTMQDWQEGALYGQVVQRDWEGVPLCCITTPLRPGGGVVGGKAPAFTPTQAIWWLNPDTFQDLADGDPVDTWATSAGPPNDAFSLPSGGTLKNGLGVGLTQVPPHNARNSLVPTHTFSLHQCSWYLVGGGAGTIATFNGPNIVGGPLAGVSSFIDNRTQLAAGTNHHTAIHNWSERAAYGLFSYLMGNGRMDLFMDGVLMAFNTIGPTDRFGILGFIKGLDAIGPFIGAATSFQEFLLFDRRLTPVEDWEVLTYLAHKYEIALGPDPTYFGFEYFAPGWFRPWFFP